MVSSCRRRYNFRPRLRDGQLASCRPDLHRGGLPDLERRLHAALRVNPLQGGQCDVHAEQSAHDEPEHQPERSPAPGGRYAACLRVSPRWRRRKARRGAAVQLPLDHVQKSAIWPGIIAAAEARL